MIAFSSRFEIFLAKISLLARNPWQAHGFHSATWCFRKLSLAHNGLPLPIVEVWGQGGASAALWNTKVCTVFNPLCGRWNNAFERMNMGGNSMWIHQSPKVTGEKKGM